MTLPVESGYDWRAHVRPPLVVRSTVPYPSERCGSFPTAQPEAADTKCIAYRLMPRVGSSSAVHVAPSSTDLSAVSAAPTAYTVVMMLVVTVVMFSSAVLDTPSASTVVTVRWKVDVSFTSFTSAN